MFSVRSSMSQKTGTACSYSRQFADATKLSGVVTTSSPALQPSARTARCSAAVPLDTATASSLPTQDAKSRSKRSSIGPKDSRPERSTSCTSSSSRGPTSGRASGICSLRHRGGETGASRAGVARGAAHLDRVLERVDECLPARLDDVLRDADRSPRLVAVGRIDQDARDRAGALVLVDDPHLVVHELDVAQARVEAGDRVAERPVERVHRAVALGGAHQPLAPRPDLDRRLGLDPAVLALLRDHAEALEPEERLVVAGLLAQEQVERGVGGLEVVPAVLELLQPLDRVQGTFGRQLDSRLLGACEHRALAGQLRHQQLAAVAHDVGAHVLEGARVRAHAGDVQAALVRERVATHVGLVRVRRHVAQLVDEMGGLA